MAKLTEVEIVRELIIKEFKFLEELGYNLSFNYPFDVNFQEYLKAEYQNEKKNRIITVSYTKSKVFADMKRSLQLTIVRMPYLDPRKDFFSQDIFLETIGYELNSPLLNEFSKVEVERRVREISKFLKIYSLEIVNGKTWKEGYFPKW